MCPYGLEIDISSSFFCTSGKENVENLKISPGQLAPCQENRIKRQQTVSSAGCRVLVPNAGFLLASMSSYCRFRPIECSYSQSVSVFVPQDKIRGSAIVNRLRPSTLPVPADPAPATLLRSFLLSWYWRQQVEIHQTRCCTHLPRAHQDAWTTRPRCACRPDAA